jgi:transposase
VNQRKEIEAILRKKTTEARLAQRARLILLAAEGYGNAEIGEKVGMGRDHVRKWRRRFENGGLEALQDMPRAGRPLEHTMADKQRVVAKVCGKPPKGRTRWSVASLAAATGLSNAFVYGVLKEHGLHPHRLRTFNFSPDPRFEEKLLEVVGLYMDPPENAIVLCMDEKTGIQALDRTQPILPLRANKPKAWSNEYVRHGTRTMLAAVDVGSGKATTWVNKTRKTADFIYFMNQVVKAYPNRRLCVVMDNLNTHTGKAAREWLDRHPHVTFHYTPTHASWVNLAECFFSILTRQGLQQAVHRSAKELTRFLEDFVAQYNMTCGPFIWTKGSEKLQRIIELTKAYQDELNAS